GGAATVVDQLGLKGVDAVAPPTEFIKKMERQGIKIERQPIIDLTLAATSEQFQYLLEAILSDNWCDAVIAVAGSSAQFHASLAVEPLIRAKKSASKPLVAFLTPEAHKSLELLRENEIAAFRTPESCADSMSSFLNTSSKELLIEQSARPISWPEELPKYGVLVESQALKVWNELGINHPKEKVINCNDLTHDIPYPLVVKVSSPDILHKTEVQGVQVGIENESELESAINKIKLSVSKRLPNARIQGFQLQQMEQNLIELIVGYRDDPTVGPIVLLGAGGITAELSEDVSIRLAPVSREQAKQMIDEVKLTKLIRGYRNLPEGNIDAIMDTITAISRLAELKDVKVLDAEINPLFVQTDRVVAVDGLIVLKDSQE
ncbi:MAG TPA: acetate--CoA ligase family protein, partial [Paenalcaligenes sp.]|nr:acetate--CoA ligase family protein [Paenalcaligenes sp.]